MKTDCCTLHWSRFLDRAAAFHGFMLLSDESCSTCTIHPGFGISPVPMTWSCIGIANQASVEQGLRDRYNWRRLCALQVTGQQGGLCVHES
jgi:hypothetical protein